jgi:hypothetical protein
LVFLQYADKTPSLAGCAKCHLNRVVAIAETDPPRLQQRDPPVVREEVSAARPRSQSKPSLPSRIAVIGNYLPRQCGIATFTTDLCAAISAEYGTARLLALPVNDTEEGYGLPAANRHAEIENH